MNRIKILSLIAIATLAFSAVPALAHGEDTEERGSNLGPSLKAVLKSGSNKDKDVAEEVLTVVEEHASTNERVNKKKNEVESRHGFRVFLIGSDYKNLGALRSELVTTQNEIERLTKAQGRATDPIVKAEIEAEIQELRATASTTESFIKTHQSKFSLFGWVVRLFSR
ncbi:hypothetical protein A3G54_00160 [Candidatus Giovannonibacteria bacterium RIFCSPLOWO2_12_FULL_44_15]|uniref:DUF5667 domain-containing protein n=1 Tax=Candidatus Giovannonibacteria bacterium RIFCSPLOWO2_12_FULL_44_15 TaxID=1798364 RepID=A0A1F5XZL5_9BACT|nr:MAG: hypothetical protein A3G54_00160 [Candidatus Giovannonibacteria bacterium RIFCSPLOWO2_12_FULL_44_15]